MTTFIVTKVQWIIMDDWEISNYWSGRSLSVTYRYMQECEGEDKLTQWNAWCLQKGLHKQSVELCSFVYLFFYFISLVLLKGYIYIFFPIEDLGNITFLRNVREYNGRLFQHILHQLSVQWHRCVKPSCPDHKEGGMERDKNTREKFQDRRQSSLHREIPGKAPGPWYCWSCFVLFVLLSLAPERLVFSPILTPPRDLADEKSSTLTMLNSIQIQHSTVHSVVNRGWRMPGLNWPNVLFDHYPTYQKASRKP